MAAAICVGSDKWQASSPQRAQEPRGDHTKGHEQDRRAAFSRDREVGRQRESKEQGASHQASCHLKIDQASLSASAVLDASRWLSTSGTDLHSNARSAVKAVSDGSPPSPSSEKCSVPRARDHIETLFEPRERSKRPADLQHRQTSDSNAASPAATSSGAVFSPKKSLKKLGRFIKSLVSSPSEAALPDRETDFRTETQQGAIARVLEYNSTRRHGDDITVMHTSLTSRNVEPKRATRQK